MDISQYFYRTVLFTRQQDQVMILDAHDLKTTTPLEPWMGTIVSLADGMHTIQQFIDYMASQYVEGPPAEFERTIDSVFERLMENKVIELSPMPVGLPNYLLVAAEEQDLNESRKQMGTDGYLKHLGQTSK